MLGVDEGAVICDLAEVYSVYDYRSLPVKLLGTLCSGLGPDSRIAMKMTGRNASRDTILLAMIRDMLSDVLHDEKDKPEHIAPILFGNVPEKTQGKAEVFSSGEDFMRRRAELIGE